MTTPDPQQAAEMLRRLLDAVESGELDADSAHARALMRRIEGAVTALDAMPEARKRKP